MSAANKDPKDMTNAELVTSMVFAESEERYRELKEENEYEHALEHVAEEHIPQCDGCRTLAQSALDGLNRDMCRELVTGDFEDDDGE